MARNRPRLGISPHGNIAASATGGAVLLLLLLLLLPLLWLLRTWVLRRVRRRQERVAAARARQQHHHGVSTPCIQRLLDGRAPCCCAREPRHNVHAPLPQGEPSNPWAAPTDGAPQWQQRCAGSVWLQVTLWGGWGACRHSSFNSFDVAPGPSRRALPRSRQPPAPSQPPARPRRLHSPRFVGSWPPSLRGQKARFAARSGGLAFAPHWRTGGQCALCCSMGLCARCGRVAHLSHKPLRQEPRRAAGKRAQRKQRCSVGPCPHTRAWAPGCVGPGGQTCGQTDVASSWREHQEGPGASKHARCTRESLQEEEWTDDPVPTVGALSSGALILAATGVHHSFAPAPRVTRGTS